MKTYTLTQSVRHDGEDYSAGDEIELNEKMATAFAERGWLEDGETKTSKPARVRRKPAKPEANDNKPTAAEVDAKPVK